MSEGGGGSVGVVWWLKTFAGLCWNNECDEESRGRGNRHRDIPGTWFGHPSSLISTVQADTLTLLACDYLEAYSMGKDASVAIRFVGR